VVSGALAVVCLGAAVGHHRTWWGPEPPRDPDALVLRIRFVKGMASPVDRPVPAVSVYGDGRMVITATDLTVTPARQVLKEQRLTGPAYRRVYRDARLAGLGASRTLRGEEQIIDAGPTVVTLVANGRRHVTTVEAGAGGPRAWMIGRLTERLRRLPRGDLVGPPAVYRPERMAVVPQRLPEGEPADPARVRPWPLRPLTAGARATCAVVTGADAEAAMRLTASGPGGARWRSGPDLYQVFFRPLLPDETDCAAVTP
jgi:hypothetical protein